MSTINSGILPLKSSNSKQRTVLSGHTMHTDSYYSGCKTPSFNRFTIIVFSFLLINLPITLFGEDVFFFTVQGLKLNMQLDDVIKTLQVNNVKSSKDKLGIAHGYEIIKTKGEMKLVLNFTGTKRLYRIDFSNQYLSFKQNSMGILDLLKKKYGDPTFENIEVLDNERRNIRACWGETCDRFTPITPALKSTIEYDTGRLKLTLIDNRIFNVDWKKYKEKHNTRKYGRNQTEDEPETSPNF